MTALLIYVMLLIQPAAGESRPLDQCVPDDAMMALMVRPAPDMLDAPPGGTIDRLATWLMAFKAVGVIPEEGRMLADLVGTLPLLSRRPHAVILMDITAREFEPEAYKLDELEAALLIDACGMEQMIDRRVRDLIATYTKQEFAQIESRRAGGYTYYRLTDNRVPAWSVIEWGMVGRHFLLGVGEGAFPRVLDTLRDQAPSIGQDKWYRSVNKKINGSNSGFTVYADIERLRGRVAEVVKGRPENVLDALDLLQTRRLLWTIGYNGKSMRSEMICRQQDGSDAYRKLAGRSLADAGVAALIPEKAGSYAVFRFDIAETYQKWRHAWLETKSQEGREKKRQVWDKLQADYQFDLQRDIYAPLGEHLILLTYPEHPLRVPLLCTTWIELNGDADRVRHALDGMMTALRDWWDRPTDTQPHVGLHPRLVKTDDDIWYLELGLVGPAVAVTDHWLVISYSPQAVRTNVQYLDKRAGQTTGQ